MNAFIIPAILNVSFQTPKGDSRQQGQECWSYLLGVKTEGFGTG